MTFVTKYNLDQISKELWTPSVRPTRKRTESFTVHASFEDITHKVRVSQSQRSMMDLTELSLKRLSLASLSLFLHLITNYGSGRP